MRRSCLLLAGLAALLPAAARADWLLGARTGFALPLGESDANASMSDLVKGQVPLQVEVAYRFRQLTLGGYFSYGFGALGGPAKTLCEPGKPCSSTSLRLGGELDWSFSRPLRRWEPWIGAGIGYESITLRRTTSLTVSGSEFLILQGGVDWRLGAAGSIGPFASFSFGTYTNFDGDAGSGPIMDRRTHEWLTVGVRGRFDLGG
ncbi:MAG TPA: hypothetical protein VIW03_00480 [Anaeromyxobacter sp.]